MVLLSIVRLSVFASVDTPNPAICGQGKTGHFGWAETSEGLPCGLLEAQVGVDLGSPAPGSALQHVRVVEQPIQ